MESLVLLYVCLCQDGQKREIVLVVKKLLSIKEKGEGNILFNTKKNIGVTKTKDDLNNYKSTVHLSL